MKRCHRFINPDTSIAQEPYHRFDFEKSLRKYEKMPSKKQKRDVLQAQHVQYVEVVQRITTIKGKAEEKAVQVNSKCEQLPVSPETTEEVRQCKQGLSSQPVRQFNAQSEPSQLNTTKNEATPNPTAQTPQQQQLPQQLPTATALQLCQQKEQSQVRSSGRFHLNSSVFISTRSLQRLMRLGSEQLVLQELFKQRQYLAQDSGEVARRVREYMEQ